MHVPLSARQDLYDQVFKPEKNTVGVAQVVIILKLFYYYPLFVCQRCVHAAVTSLTRRSSAIPLVGGILGSMFSVILFVTQMRITVATGKLDKVAAVADV